MLGQELRRALTDKTDAKTVDHAFQRQLLRALDFIQNILRGLFAHAFELQQIGLSQFVNVGDVFHHAALGKLIDQRVAYAVNIHDAT